MEACGGSQYWARKLNAMGHEVKLMPGEFVKAFVMGNKSDAVDAKAIWLAVQHAERSVAVKTETQHAVLGLHRMREQLVKFRAMQINGLRGLLTEYGEVMGKGRAALDKAIPIYAGARITCCSTASPTKMRTGSFYAISKSAIALAQGRKPASIVTP